MTHPPEIPVFPQEAICVSEVHKDGVAYQDGRLKKGDVILAVSFT